MKNSICDLKHHSWYLWERLPRISLLVIWSPVMAFCTRLEKLYGVGLFRCIFIYKNREFFMYNIEGGLEAAGRKLLAMEDERPGFILSILQEIEEYSTRLRRSAKELHAKEIESFSTTDLADRLTELFNLHEETWVRGQAPNLLEHGHSMLGERLKSHLEHSGISRDEIPHVANILTKPRKYSYLQKEEQDLLNLSDASVDEHKLKAHREYYAWLGADWIGGAGYDVQYFQERLTALQNDPGREVFKKSEEAYRDDINRQRDDVIRKYGLSNEVLRTAHMIERTILMKAYRVDVSWYFYWVLNPLLERIARERGYSVSQTWFLKPNEIIDIVRGIEVDADLLNKRSSMYAISFGNGTIEEFFGEPAREAFEYLNQITTSATIDVQELKGDTGSPGTARGIVRVVNTTEEMKKMEQGNILVSHMTSPRLVPAMKLAVGIVADIGGVTSHAAIVSRELGIPCVIGTKIATQVLKDGMEVEVDANTGIVKILS